MECWLTPPPRDSVRNTAAAREDFAKGRRHALAHMRYVWPPVTVLLHKAVACWPPARDAFQGCGAVLGIAHAHQPVVRNRKAVSCGLPPLGRCFCGGDELAQSRVEESTVWVELRADGLEGEERRAAVGTAVHLEAIIRREGRGGVAWGEGGICAYNATRLMARRHGYQAGA
eukprot:scaffold12939_cov97-Isochrysis_galbana.AAC.3